MIDEIVEMILKEARARDRDNLFVSVFHVLEEITDQIFPMIFKQRIEERRKKENEDNHQRKQCKDRG